MNLRQLSENPGALAAIGALGLLAVNVVPLAAHEVGGGREQRLFQTELRDAPGQSLTAMMVSYPPGGASPAHSHAGSVYAFVVSGSIRSENSATGPARVYHAGESFYEPPGSRHLVSRNASEDTPAQLLAVFVAPSGATLTTMEH